MKAIKGVAAVLGVLVLVALALVGWYVLLAQKPDILAKARLRYNQAVAEKTDLSSGPCLGEIANGWVLDIAHLPREDVDNLPQNQCHNFLHFVEMSPQGEVIVVQ